MHSPLPGCCSGSKRTTFPLLSHPFSSGVFTFYFYFIPHSCALPPFFHPSIMIWLHTHTFIIRLIITTYFIDLLFQTPFLTSWHHSSHLPIPNTNKILIIPHAFPFILNSLHSFSLSLSILYACFYLQFDKIFFHHLNLFSTTTTHSASLHSHLHTRLLTVVSLNGLMNHRRTELCSELSLSWDSARISSYHRIPPHPPSPFLGKSAKAALQIFKHCTGISLTCYQRSLNMK